MRAALLALLPVLASAAVVDKRSAAANAGATTSDVFPPASTSVNSKLFPPESVVGYPGATVTGVEPAAIETAAAYATNDGSAANYPLVADQPNGDSSDANFDIFKYWGNLSPWYSVPSSTYGLNYTTPNVPDGCSVTQLQLLYRHGARYPTSGAAPSTFAAKVHNATTQGGFNATGDLAFLNQWTYKLGAELLTPFGRLQNFELGVAARQQYGHLLNNFTQNGALPVFRTESQDRMVKTANNFAAGFFGVPEYLDQVSIELMVETPGVNNTGAPYETCTNSNVASRGSIGSTAATAFAKNAFNSTLERLNGQVTGSLNFTATDAIAMLQLCSYETDALGYSSFCQLFTEEDFQNYEYYYDISFYYNNGAGSPVAAAQGLGFLQEFVARWTQTPITSSSTTINATLDSNSTYFPLNQSFYADATHEVVLLDTFTAMNLTALFSSGPVNPTQRSEGSFVASKVVPFGTHLHMQKLECSNTSPSTQMRFIINDAVLPLDQSYSGCDWNEDGLCSFETVISALQARIKQIEAVYDEACYGNYNATVGHDYNGLPPTSSS